MANLRLPIDLAPITDGLRTVTETLKVVRDSVAILPEVAKTLEEIRKATISMAEEVHLMRTGVDELGVEVKGMRAAVDPLVEHLDNVAVNVAALEPRLEDLSLAIHPMRRATSKLTRRRGANGDAEDGLTERGAGSDRLGRERVAVRRIAGGVTAFEPLAPLLGGAVGERVGVDGLAGLLL